MVFYERMDVTLRGVGQIKQQPTARSLFHMQIRQSTMEQLNDGNLKTIYFKVLFKTNDQI
jgi:hypothetical protein